MKKKTQLFAEQIAAEVLDIPLATVSKAMDTAYAASEGAVGTAGDVAVTTEELRGIDLTALLAFVEAIGELLMKLMGGCPQQRSGIREAIKRPPYLVKLGVRVQSNRIFSNSPVSGIRSLGSKAAEVLLARGPQAPDDMAFAVIDECNTVDNWI